MGMAWRPNVQRQGSQEANRTPAAGRVQATGAGAGREGAEGTAQAGPPAGTPERVCAWLTAGDYSAGLFSTQCLLSRYLLHE